MTDNQTQDVAEAIKIVQAVKEHLQEQECTHNIQTIVKEALESESVGPTKTRTQQTTDAATTRGQSKWKLQR